MKLPFLTDKKEKSEYYLALLLTDEKANAVILETIEGKIKIISRHEMLFPASIEELATEGLIEVLDKTISKAEEILPPNVETHKAVFGLKKNWIDPETKKIQKDYLAKLKKVCGDLELVPMGFMVTTEAISSFLQEEEGAPLSAILAEIGKKQVTATLLRGGKIVETIAGDLQESAAATLDTLLKHFTVPVLPARIILLDGNESEKLSQQFIAHQWSKSLPLLHVPQITVLPEGFDSRAVTFGAATQMGLEVLDLDKKPVKDLDTAHGAKHEKHAEEEISEETKKEHASEEHHHTQSIDTVNAADFGFLVNQEITDAKPHHVNHETPKVITNTSHQMTHANLLTVEEIDEEEEEAPRSKRLQKRFSLPSLSSLIPTIKLPRFGGGSQPKIPLPFLIPLVLLLILLGGITYFYFFNTKATITLTVNPKKVEHTASVVFSTTTANDFSKNIIAAKAISATVDGETTTPATGKKDIGDKAKGTVTILSSSSKEINIASGTILTSSNGLKFVTDKEVKIASSSGVSDIKNTQVAVTADEIGKEHNFPSGTKFSVGSFDKSTVEAKNDNAFSGGSKKSATVVSKEDQSKVKADLLKVLEGKAREALAKEAGSDETILPVYTNSGFSKPKFDKDVGDEAKAVKLTGSVTFKGLAYKNSDLEDYAKATIKDKEKAQDSTLADNSQKEIIKDAKIKNDKEAQASVVIEAGLLPEMDTQDVLKQLQGKSIKQASFIIAEFPQVATSDITFSPNISFLANIFSRLPNNISVSIKSE